MIINYLICLFGLLALVVSLFYFLLKSLVLNFQVVLVTVTVWQYFCGLTCTVKVKPSFFTVTRTQRSFQVIWKCTVC